MAAERFYADRSVGRTLLAAGVVWIAAALSAHQIAEDQTLWHLILLVFLIYGSLLMTALLRNTSRPVIEFIDGQVRYAPRGALRVGSLDLSDIEEVTESRNPVDRGNTLRVRLRSGRVAKVRLRELSEGDRSAVRARLDPAGR